MRMLLLLLLPLLSIAESPQNGRKHLNQQFVRDELASVFGSPFAQHLRYESDNVEKVCITLHCNHSALLFTSLSSQ
jgi:hypothetical protein